MPRGLLRLVATLWIAGNALVPLAWTPWDDGPLQTGVEIVLDA